MKNKFIKELKKYRLTGILEIISETGRLMLIDKKAVFSIIAVQDNHSNAN